MSSSSSTITSSSPVTTLTTASTPSSTSLPATPPSGGSSSSHLQSSMITSAPRYEPNEKVHYDRKSEMVSQNRATTKSYWRSWFGGARAPTTTPQGLEEVRGPSSSSSSSVQESSSASSIVSMTTLPPQQQILALCCSHSRADGQGQATLKPQIVNNFTKLSTVGKLETISCAQVHQGIGNATINVLKNALTEDEQKELNEIVYATSRASDNKLPKADGISSQRKAGATYFMLSSKTSASQEAIERLIERTKNRIDDIQTALVRANMSLETYSKDGETRLQGAFAQLSIKAQLPMLLEFAQKAQKAVEADDTAILSTRLKKAIMLLKVDSEDYLTMFFSILVNSVPDENIEFLSQFGEGLIEGNNDMRKETLKMLVVDELVPIIEKMQKQVIEQLVPPSISSSSSSSSSSSMSEQSLRAPSSSNSSSSSSSSSSGSSSMNEQSLGAPSSSNSSSSSSSSSSGSSPMNEKSLSAPSSSSLSSSSGSTTSVPVSLPLPLVGSGSSLSTAGSGSATSTTGSGSATSTTGSGSATPTTGSGSLTST